MQIVLACPTLKINSRVTFKIFTWTTLGCIFTWVLISYDTNSSNRRDKEKLSLPSEVLSKFIVTLKQARCLSLLRVS